MVAADLVQWHVQDGVGHLVLNRPEAANALNSAMCEAFEVAVACAARADVGAVLLSAQGRQFCAGGDIQEFLVRRADLHRLVKGMLDALHPAIHRLAMLPVPVVSAVQGPLGGAGIALALSADFVLAADTIKLRGGYSAIGLSPDLGASFHLARRGGAIRAKQVLLRNQAITAQTCLQWGLVDELHAPETLLDAAQALASQMARGPRAAQAGIKALCDRAWAHSLRTHLDLERAALLDASLSAAADEGIQAFIDKRTPDFAGL